MLANAAVPYYVPPPGAHCMTTSHKTKPAPKAAGLRTAPRAKTAAESDQAKRRRVSKMLDELLRRSEEIAIRAAELSARASGKIG